MDLMKIGRYIAEKRKKQGLTQRQVAEQLGMSDKSVSKWERGICLPDVSIYSSLCEILGISINEFLAGEDIKQENIAEKSEENIISITTDGKRRQRRLKIIIGLLIVIFIGVAAAAVAVAVRSSRPQNYIVPAARDSVEMKTAEMLAGPDGAFVYQYMTTDEFSELIIYVSEYRSGKLVKKEPCTLTYDGIESPKQGTILLVPDFETFQVKLIIADDRAKLSSEIPILDQVSGREYYGRSASQIEEKTDICYGKEQGLAALIYGKEQVSVVPIQDLEAGNTEVLSVNDYMYYFSVQFCKEK